MPNPRRKPRTTAPPLADIRPMLAAEKEIPFDEPGWTHELKYDGYRLLAEVDEGRVALQTRNGANATRWFPELAAPLATLATGRQVIDGEVCVLDELGRSDFDRLQQRAKRRGYKAGDAAVVYCVFDLLVRSGIDMRSRPFVVRKAALRELLSERLPSLLLVDDFPGRGMWLFAQACALSLEGIVSKRLDAPYESGVRSPAWVKVKRPGAVPPQRFRRGG